MNTASPRGARVQPRSIQALRLTAGELALACIGALAVAAALWGLLGLRSAGLALLATLAPYAGGTIVALLAFGVVLAAAAASVWAKPAAARGGAAAHYPIAVRAAALGVTGLYVAAALAIITSVLQFDLLHAGPVGPGQYGVAVAQFQPASGADGSADPAALSTLLARSLRREIESSPALRGKVTVLAAPVLQSTDQARAFAAANDVSLVVWGRATGSGFAPSVAVFEPKDYQLWYGDVPAPHDAPLTGDGSLELGETGPGRASGLVDYLVGLIHLGRGSDRAAADRLQAALASLAPEGAAGPDARTLAAIHLALGRAQAGLGARTAARDEYRGALAQDARFAPAHIGLGNLSYEEGDCRAALDEFDRAVQLAPDLPISRYSRGNGYYCLQRYTDAVRDYRAAIRSAPPGPDSANIYYLVLGVTLCQSGRTADGLAELARAHEGNLILSAEAKTQSCLEQAQTIAQANKTLAMPAPAPAPTLEPSPAAVAGLVPDVTPERGPAVPWSLPFWWTATRPTPRPSLTPGAVQLPPLFVRDLPTAAPAGRGFPPAPTAGPVAWSTPAAPDLPPEATATEAPSPNLPTAPTTTDAPPTWTPGPRLPISTPVPPTSTPLPTLAPPTLAPLPSPTWTLTPRPTATLVPPTATRQPTWTPSPAPTWTPVPPTPTPRPTATPLPPTPVPPTATMTDLPTDIPAPTATVEPPTITPLPSDTPTPDVEPTPLPTDTPSTGKTKPPRPPTKTPKP